jgi:hypothetical protein
MAAWPPPHVLRAGAPTLAHAPHKRLLSLSPPSPAHFCGIYALKPTPQRVIGKGTVVPRKSGRSGNETIKPVAGPMGRW